MAHPRTPTVALLSGMALAAALGALLPSSAHAGDGDGACAATKFNFPAVEKACKDGGRKAVKTLMKASVKKAKAAGKDVKCTSCHEDLKGYKLKDNAVADLKPYI